MTVGMTVKTATYRANARTASSPAGAIWWDGPVPDPLPAPDVTLADLGEFGLIDHVARIVKEVAPGEDVLVGPGDDGAVLRVRKGHVVVSTDLMIEGRHFRKDWERRPTSATGPRRRTSPTSTRWVAARPG